MVASLQVDFYASPCVLYCFPIFQPPNLSLQLKILYANYKHVSERNNTFYMHDKETHHEKFPSFNIESNQNIHSKIISEK